MGNGPYSLTRACFTIVAISSVLWTRSCARPKYASWNNTRDWKRELADKEGYFTNTWAVEIDPAEEHVVANIAKKHGFSIIGQIGDLPGHYHLRHDDVDELNKEHNRDKTDRLLLEKEVKWAEQQKILHRVKRDGIPTDPKFKEMWYLLNEGQTGGPVGVDINVLPVWRDRKSVV